ncbi:MULTISPECIES: TAXI family TRAP transporter solute-binding subunit [unclassified Streptomyces]|uniref:TAXI family TRAP transporter solute-binding subunit n=1 Tax=unclassified Streptomyces TaxID=2593676 RepID=UPI002251B8E6|nr:MULTISPECIES: TAXI family TRAP transporter solute-binding subunit [unclassified Streptomyces]MCX4528499.1 TAXI family TRAP transporter solute-binding subunit [Streptomyces sp. NBC_01551]MCX4540903.1 TAXI family TRAP transporter solute-binding subunit [Streptomyces sp. NBC_01565]
MHLVLPRISRRRVLRGLVVVLAVLAALLWWLKPFGEPELKGDLTLSTGVRTGVYHLYGELLQQALATDMPGVNVRLEPSEGSQQNLQRVAAGQADFTVATADAVAKYRADGKPGAEALRGCARLYDDYVQLVVPAGSPVQSTADLKGKRVAVGQSGSGVRLIADRLLTAAKLNPARDIKPVSIGIDTMPAELEAGRIDAFFWSGGLPTNAVRELSERFDIRLVQLGDLVERLQAGGSPARYYRAAVMPQDAYGRARNTSAVATVAVPNLLVTTAATDPKLTEQFTRTVILSRDRIGHEVHAAQLVDLRTAIYTDPLDLHEGAGRYYRSVKP